MSTIKAQLKFKRPLTPLVKDDVRFIVLHHIASKKATPQDIHRWHLARGWNGFGYNEYIKRDGTVYIGRGDNVGAHVKGYNSKSYGIAVEGHYNEQVKMPEKQFNALIERIKIAQKTYPNAEKVVKHGQLDNTSCPGKNFPFDRVLKQVAVDIRDILQKLDRLEKDIGLLKRQIRKALTD